MKKITRGAALVALLLAGSFSANAQQKTTVRSVEQSERTRTIREFQPNDENQRFYEENGVYRCGSDEYNEALREAYPNLRSADQFEGWLAPLLEERKRVIAEQKANGTYRRATYNIPIIFHVLTGGTGNTNIPQSLIQAQIDQLNLDFSDGAGSTNPVSADSDIQFVPCVVDPNGNTLAEPGINRITTYGAGPHTTATLDNVIKPNTIWDRTRYCNIWTANLSGGLLGYAQFPEGSGLPGMPTGNEPNNTDGVVCLNTSIGSVANPHPDGGIYASGRTLTHEIGHWIGLRHIWGDSTCGTDYCADTPTAQDPASGCPNKTTCDGQLDQVQNYMDYSNDTCMDLFTFDQVGRMQIVMENSPGRKELPDSNTAGPQTPQVVFTTTSSSNNEGSTCSFTDVTTQVSLSSAATGNTTVTFSVDGASTGTNNVDFELMTSSVSFASGATGARDMTVRVYHDSFVEGDETAVINFAVSGSDAEAGGNNSLTITIADDDTAAPTNPSTTLFSDGFESYTAFDIGNVGGWTMNDGDGDAHYGDADVDFTNENYTGTFIVFNPSQTTPAASANWNPRTGNQGYYCFASTGNVSGVAENDDHIFTPQITLSGSNSELRFWARTLDNTWGLERFNAKVSTTNTNLASFTTIQPTSGASTQSYHEVPVAWTEYVYDLSAYDGQSIYIAIHNVSADSYVFMLDDISVTTNKGVQTAVNDGTTNAQFDLPTSGSVYTSDSASGDLMLDITNNNTHDYGCTTAAVFRAGTGAQAYDGSTTPNLAMDKVFDINPGTVAGSGDTTVKFYFTEAEIAGWEAATGNSRNDLVAYRTSGSEIVSLTAGAFGTNVTMTGNFTGLSGQYYFGTQATFEKVTITPKVYLQGAFTNPNGGEETLMRDDLRVAGSIPTTSPYSDALTTNATVFNTTGANAIVDWVWVELRDSADFNTVLESQSGLLQRDGDVAGTDGTSGLVFNQRADNYYLVVRHRNHLSIMSATAVAMSGSNAKIDMSSSDAAVYGGSNAVNAMTGRVAMVSGDFDDNGQVQTSDVNGLIPLIGNAGYSIGDFDMNGQVQTTDLNAQLFTNVGRGQQY